jgi:hypothetical protein
MGNLDEPLPCSVCKERRVRYFGDVCQKCLETPKGRKAAASPISVRLGLITAEEHARKYPPKKSKKLSFGEWVGLILLLLFLIFTFISALGIPKNSEFWEQNDRSLDEFDRITR